MSATGRHEADLSRCPQFCRYRVESGHGDCERRLPSLTDAVEKVENRRTLKISQMVSFELLRRCDAL
jgi:hypothetical protein